MISGQDNEVASTDTLAQPQARLDFFNLTRAELAKVLQERLGEPAYRATQLFQWVYRKGITDFAQMSDLRVDLRAGLAALFEFPKAGIESREISNDGTRKYLFKVGDKLVESVMIKQPNRMTLCVSSQVGCGMGCKFCRTATMGFIRHLKSSEILQQVLGVIEDAKNFGDRFQNMVFMGMGEPLHNFDGVSAALRILTDHNGLAISQRRITVSTVGLVPAIKRFADEQLPANLAVSLNATTDEIRSQVMPVNDRFSIEELLATLRAAGETMGKEITIEYVMLSGINDSADDLERLPNILQGLHSKINLIPYNENAGLGFKTPKRDWVDHWRTTLMNKGFNATVRWSKGQDIKAACGQLVTSSQRERKAQTLPIL